ncbi:protein TIFY 8 [Vigna radiata var. radiata]|uniref:Protein TIFY n=1 Tax=Vigna radiata var. radiata TaxID=3916 RepID=A0A1S3UDF3_VIGRR|nr:protein TIFY 8 [Vigna radiata var. radiata]
MAQQNNANNNVVTQQKHQQLLKPMFHDFLGTKTTNPIHSNVLYAPQTSHLYVPRSSLSSTTVFSGAATSHHASEKQTGNHLEGVPYYGPKRESCGIEIANRVVRKKKSNSDTTFTFSSRDSFQMVPHSLPNSHSVKMLRNAATSDCLRRSNGDDMFLPMQSLKPTTSGSQILQTPTGTKSDANKLERSILMNFGPFMQLAPLMDQRTSNKMGDTSAAPSFISQLAADEGSRTRIKGPGLFSSINTINAVTEKTSSMLGGSRAMPVTNIADPESSTILNQRGSSSATCQMTIFYGGQAHVFDDVQPNKADVIMDLAGSNGGSWATAFSSKSSVRLHHDSNLERNSSHHGGQLTSTTAEVTRKSGSSCKSLF